MEAFQFHSLLAPFLLFNIIHIAKSQSVIQMPNRHHRHMDAGVRQPDLNCDSWRLSIEANNAGCWETVPSECTSFVENYMTGKQYLSDSKVVAYDSLAFAQSVNIAGDGKDVWVFDIDDTLLSTLPFHQAHGFRSKPLEKVAHNAQSTNIDIFDLPALPASLRFYNKLLDMNFTIILLTGRTENLRNGTVQNLHKVGYAGWERLYLREECDEEKEAVVYKSEKRIELVNEGYKIHGSSGDQWSDLLGYAVAQRSFKLPNPMYYIA